MALENKTGKQNFNFLAIFPFNMFSNIFSFFFVTVLKIR